MERLSSGLRINSAGDDAAGLAIASRMEAQVRGLQMVKVQMMGFTHATAEGAMDEISNILHRMRELGFIWNDLIQLRTVFLTREVEQLEMKFLRLSTTQFNG